MGVNVNRLRAALNVSPSRLTGDDWSTIDYAALIAGVVATAWLQIYILQNSHRPDLVRQIVAGVISFSATATGVYALWYLPQLIILFLSRYWWAVVLVVSALIYWFNR